jgi:tRNA pseudouridine55 synthase
MLPDPMGILLVDKPKGPTSHDMVDLLRHRFHIKRVGHCGTLDPMATGLLVLVVGRATKLSEKLTGEDKEYEGTLRLGKATDSQDAEGQVTSEKPVPPLTEAAIRETFARFTGDIMQTPPMVSAKKVGGVPLYKLARKGKEIERKARLIHVYRLEVLKIQLPDVEFRLFCTKGTYVRTICHDIGETVGCGGHLAQLRRTASGEFRIDKAHTVSEIESWNQEALMKHLISPLDLKLSFGEV